MRGGARAMSKENHRVTPKLLAEDIVGILNEMKLEPASIMVAAPEAKQFNVSGKVNDRRIKPKDHTSEEF